MEQLTPLKPAAPTQPLAMLKVRNIVPGLLYCPISQEGRNLDFNLIS